LTLPEVPWPRTEAIEVPLPSNLACPTKTPATIAATMDSNLTLSYERQSNPLSTALRSGQWLSQRPSPQKKKGRTNEEQSIFWRVLKAPEELCDLEVSGNWGIEVGDAVRGAGQLGGRDEADGDGRGDAAVYRSCGWAVIGIEGEDPGWTGAGVGVG